MFWPAAARSHGNVSRRCAFVAAVAYGMCAWSGEPEVAPACQDRQVTEPPTPIEQTRLPELEYECATLRSGQRVLIGRAGESGLETVLLVHGLGNNAHRDWRNVVPQLARQYRVVALDLPGFGASDAPALGYSFATLSATLAEVLDRDSIARAHVVGHSLGGAITLYFAHTYPERVQRLVLVDAAGILLKSVYVHHVSRVSTPEVGFRPLDRLLDKVDSRINGLSRNILQHFENRFDFSSWLADNPEVRLPLLGRFTQTDAALGLIEHDFSQAIRETKAPTSIIWGRNDDVSPVRVGKLLAGRMPDARLHVIERTGHVPMNESAREFMPLLTHALAGSPSTEPSQELAAEPRSVHCRGEADQVYVGRFTTVTLENCRDARIENARIEKLSLKDSSAQLEYVSIASADIALEATNSFITATVLDIAGRIGISSHDSQLDFAGTSIRAQERGINVVTPSRIYFSVSDVDAPDRTGDLHEIWNGSEAK